GLGRFWFMSGLWKNGLFTFAYLGCQFVVFFKPETVEAVLSSPEHIEKSWEYRLLRPWIGTGLITSPRTKWHKHRKLVTPTFHFSILDTFIPVFQKQANVLISKIQSHIQEPWIDIVPLMSLCTLDIIC
ncbi:Cytochrome P450 4c3, partial [Araneus ventricosus]